MGVTVTAYKTVSTIATLILVPVLLCSLFNRVVRQRQTHLLPGGFPQAER